MKPDMIKKVTISNDLFFADVEKIIESGQSVSIRVKGYSMHPFLRNNTDTVVLSAINPTELRKGMVVLFRYSDKYFLHRIHRIHNDKLVIRGDGNYRQSELASTKDVIAYVEAMVRDEKRIRYGTAAWHTLTLYSLSRKLLRTLKADLKRRVQKIVGR